MRLKSFRVRMYRNIVDSEQIDVERDITCLVGMNEAGKTSVLSALHRLLPVDTATFVAKQDYPRWLLKQDSRAGKVDGTRPIEATFDIEPDDVAVLADLLGEKVLQSETYTLNRTYEKGALGCSTVSCDAQAAIRHLVTQSEIPTVAAGFLIGVPDFPELIKAATDGRATLAAAEEPDAEAIAALDALIERVRDVSASGTTPAPTGTRVSQIAINVLTDRTPRFFYFDEYSFLSGRIDLSKLAAPAPLEDEEIASSADQTARSLLRLADTSPEELIGDDYEDQVAELEAVGNQLSSELQEYWRQNPDLRVQFRVQMVAAKSAHGEQIVKRILDIRVEDTRHQFTNNFDRRSSGFRWFFSFLAAFNEFETRAGNFIVLLDEPGLNLHGRAQADFIRFMNKRLATASQVLYTTHSPFMVETNRLERVRIVEDGGALTGSSVSKEVLAVDADSLFPLQAALGYDIAQHLFIGDANLLVEGPSDLLYLDTISRHLGGLGRTALAPDWRVLPAGGSANIPAFVALIGGQLEVTVLIDSGTEGAQRLEAAIAAQRLDRNRLIAIKEITGTNHADIEDLFAEEDYLLLYNAAFQAKVRTKDLPPGDRIVKRIEVFAEKYDHYRPAEVLLRQQGDLLPKMSAQTLDRFEALITRINGTRP